MSTANMKMFRLGQLYYEERFLKNHLVAVFFQVWNVATNKLSITYKTCIQELGLRLLLAVKNVGAMRNEGIHILFFRNQTIL